MLLAHGLLEIQHCVLGAGVRQHGLEGESGELAGAAKRCGARVMLLLMPTEARRAGLAAAWDGRMELRSRGPASCGGHRCCGIHCSTAPPLSFLDLYIHEVILCIWQTHTLLNCLRTGFQAY